MMKIRADLHNHLRTSSKFIEGDFNAAINKAREELGEGGIFGMVNFADARYEEFIGLRGYERAPLGDNSNGVYIPDKKIIIVKGQEVPTREGHLLVLGLGRDIHLKNHRSLEDTIKEARDNGAITIADHPFYLSGIGKSLLEEEGLLNQLDAIEVHNGEAAFGFPIGPIPFEANPRSSGLYPIAKHLNPHLGAISSSDGHSFYELGSSWTQIKQPNLESKTEFIPSLRDAIRGSDMDTPMKKSNSYCGAIDHIADLIFIAKIAPKIGLKSKFETYRPE